MKNKAAYFGSAIVILSGLLATSGQQTAHAANRQDDRKSQDPVAFQAPGPTAASIQTTAHFLVAGGKVPATASALGAAFSDVDQSGDRWDSGANTSVLFYGVHGNLLFRADVPASQGDGSLSFVGVLFDKARLSFVRIRTGNVSRGPNDTNRRDVLTMDDFIFGEPQAIAQRDSQAATLPEMD